MLNLLSIATFFNEVWDRFLINVQRPWMWMAIAFAAFGLAVTMLARRIARIIRKQNHIDNSDGALITFKTVGLMFVVAAVIILIIIT